MSVLAEQLLAVHAALDAGGLPHAFGGAIALAYCTQEPRGTRDLDVNVFVPPDRAGEVLDALPEGVAVTPATRRTATRDGQVRVMWANTPIDLFFDTHDFYREAAEGVVTVPFEQTTIPVVGCTALAVFKAMYGRTRDWADIESILDAGAIDGHTILRRLEGLLSPDDPALARLAQLLD